MPSGNNLETERLHGSLQQAYSTVQYSTVRKFQEGTLTSHVDSVVAQNYKIADSELIPTPTLETSSAQGMGRIRAKPLIAKPYNKAPDGGFREAP